MEAERRASGAASPDGDAERRQASERRLGVACLLFALILIGCADSLSLPGAHSDAVYYTEVAVYWVTPAIMGVIAFGALQRSGRFRERELSLHPFAALLLAAKAVFSAVAIHSELGKPGGAVFVFLYFVIIAPAIALAVLLLAFWSTRRKAAAH